MTGDGRERNGFRHTCVLLLLGGCANYATLQDPETMPEGDTEFGLGATFTKYEFEIETTTTDPMTGQSTVETERESFGIPALTLSLRHGVAERLELHGMAWMPFGATIGGKYMLIGDRKQTGFVLSPGLDVGYLSVSVGDESTSVVGLYGPSHRGVRTSAGFAVYATPKYVLRIAGGDLGHVGGGTLGIAVGEETQFLAEGSLLYDTLVQSPIIQGGVAVAFR